MTVNCEFPADASHTSPLWWLHLSLDSQLLWELALPSPRSSRGKEMVMDAFSHLSLPPGPKGSALALKPASLATFSMSLGHSGSTLVPLECNPHQ
jgi:hypothetical protein